MLKSMLHIAIFLNGLVVGRCLIIEPTENYFEEFLSLAFSVACINVFIFAGTLLVG